MTTPVRKLVVIEDSMILSMSQNQQFLSEFPFLAGIGRATVAKKGGCSACRGNRDRAQVLNAAKAAIAGMSADKKKKLLRLLNTEKVRIIYNDGRRTLNKTIEGG